MWCLCTIDSIRNRFLPWSPYLSLDPRRLGCARESKKSSLSAGQSIDHSQPLLSQPQPAQSSVSLALTASNSSESDSCSVCASIGVEETAVHASQPWYEALNLSGAGSLTDPFANPRTVAYAVPQQQWDQSPGEREPERPSESVHRSVCKASISSALSSADCACSSPNKQHRECVYLHPLNNAGRGEYTS